MERLTPGPGSCPGVNGKVKRPKSRIDPSTDLPTPECWKAE